MKKIFCLGLIIATIVLNTGCSKKSSDVIAVTTGLSFTAEITYQELELICSVNTDKNGNAEFVIVSPEEISDLAFCFKGADTFVSYKGLEHKLNTALPQTNAINSVYNILENVNQNKNKVTENDGKYLLKGEIGGDKYTIYLGATGLPIEISCNDGLKAVIKDVTVIK